MKEGRPQFLGDEPCICDRRNRQHDVGYTRGLSPREIALERSIASNGVDEGEGQENEENWHEHPCLLEKDFAGCSN